jgi:hypothetical protein
MKRSTTHLTICVIALGLLSGCRGDYRIGLGQGKDGKLAISGQQYPEYQQLHMTFNVQDTDWHSSLCLSLPPSSTRFTGNSPTGEAPFTLHSTPREIEPTAAKVEIVFPADSDPDLAEVRVEVFWNQPDPDISSDERTIHKVRVATLSKSDVDELIMDLEQQHQEHVDRTTRVVIEADKHSREISTSDFTLLKSFVKTAWLEGAEPVD